MKMGCFRYLFALPFVPSFSPHRTRGGTGRPARDRKGGVLRLTIAGAAGLYVLATTAIAGAAPIATVDQQNLLWTGLPGVGTNHSFGQSFVPTLTGIDAIEFDLRIVSGAPVAGVVHLRDGVIGADGLAGPILATSAPVVISGSTPLTYQFVFSSTVALTPGQSYVGHFVAPTNTSVMGFRAHDFNSNPTDVYPAGQFVWSGFPVAGQDRFDMVFTEGLIPEPVSAGLTLVGVVTVVAAQRRARRRRSAERVEGLL